MSILQRRALLRTLTAALLAVGVCASSLALAAETKSTTTEVVGPGGTSVSLYAEETGSGAPIVLLHGLGASTFTWRKIVPALARDHRVIALDMLGFGRSDKPLDADYSADAEAQLVAAFMEKLSLEGVTLIGHSFGGTVALRVASRPDAGKRIARLVIISAPALPEAAASYLDAIEIPAVPDAVTIAMPPDLIARLLLKEAHGGSNDVSEEDVVGYAAPYHDVAAKRTFLAAARGIVSETGAKTIAARYRTIEEPKLLVWCRNDTVVPLRSGRELARTLRGADLTVMTGCHHLPQDEQPAKLIDIITSFVDGRG